MSIAQKIEKYYSNRIDCIKKMSKSDEKDIAIGAFICDLGKRSISKIAKIFDICFRKAKDCLNKFIYGKQLKIEFRGRKKITIVYPNLISDIENVIEKYKNVDSHFKTETLYVSINPKSIIEELVSNYNYPTNFCCYNTMKNLIKEMGYKLHKIPKTMVQDKIKETDKIFANVHDALEGLNSSNNNISFISIDDKATKKIGKISDNGSTWIDIKAMDHDTNFKYSIKPFGILDLKTNETFVYCTPYSSTAEFKVDCIEKYIKYKNEKCILKKLVIFLDNGPENSSRRKLWLKCLVNISIKYNLIIELIYYPPYHSKYNKIERYWARLQMTWNKVIIDTAPKLVDVINKTSWNGVNSKCYFSIDEYKTGIKITDYEMNNHINPHIIREEELKKWSLVITPYIN